MTVSINGNTATRGHARGDTISNFENLTGSAYDDVLTGDANANVLKGGDGNDVLKGAAGADTLNGGDGNDTASYAGSSAAVTVNLTTATHSGGDAQGDTLSEIENVTGSDHNDTITGSAKGNSIEGGAGDDTLDGGTNVSGADRFLFHAGFGNDTISNHKDTDEFYVCIAGATVARDKTTVRTLITVSASDGSTSGTITITGDHDASTVNVFVRQPGNNDCQHTPTILQPDLSKLRPWWTDETPYLVDTGTESDPQIRMWFRVGTSKPASALCDLDGATVGGGGTSINCPPFTLVSLVPVDKPTDVNNKLTITAAVTGTNETAAPMVQSFHYYGHSPVNAVMSAGDGAIGLVWTDGATIHDSASINGYEVQHRVLGETGDWTSSGVLAADAFTYTIRELTNGITYEIRVATRNNAGDTDASTHWWGPSSYDTATPQAANFALPGQITVFGLGISTNPGVLNATWGNPRDEVPEVLYLTLRHKQTSQGDSAWVEQTIFINRSFAAQQEPIQGLTGGVEYTAQIRAHNVNGAGPWKEAKRTPN